DVAAAKRELRIECLPIIRPSASTRPSVIQLAVVFQSSTNIDDVASRVYSVYHIILENNLQPERGVLISDQIVQNGIMDKRKSLARRNSKTRERILVAAIQRFSKFGYRRTSINDVAKEAGLARATVYLYWRRKEDLFVAGLERFNSHSWSLADTAAAKKGPAADRIRAMVMAQYGATSDIVHGTASGHEVFEA